MVELELVPEEFLALTAFVPDTASVMEYLRSYAPLPAAPMMWSDD